MAEMSTAVSDFVLAISAFGGAMSLVDKNLVASLGFLSIGIAATVGSYRFSRAEPSPTLIYWHKTFAWYASVLGMSMLASGLHRHIDSPFFSATHMGCALSLVVMSKVFRAFTDNIEATLATGVSGAAVISIGLFSFLHSNPFGMLGALVFLAAGAIGAKEGTISGVKKVDWFHYFLAFANIVMIRALQFKPSEIYYKPKE
ncbi:uncharacterized protein [Amphiura filiformis]|uniref:uncharacterized protein n=1 Tax=Amphiura filiformis TaxID=82378 RepID=UPI003B219115